MHRRSALLGLIALGAMSVAADRVQAAEDATGFYLLGAKASMAGYLPPPGTYLSTYHYYYEGDASGSAAVGAALQGLGNLTAEADINLVAQAYYELPTFIWVAPEKVLGGNIAFGAIVPVGWEKVDVGLDVRAALTLPNGTTLTAGRSFDIDDDEFNFGDPVPTAILGWHEGNWYWNIAALLNVPIGQYDKDKNANIGFHRWGVDITPAVTWLDPRIGLELSTAAGFTFNGENPDTDYKTGTEFHVEFAVMQHFSKTFAIGLVGYHYQQVTGDSGAGAVLGDFEGRATALGPNVTYSFVCGSIPVSTELKYLHEFDVENRVEGNAGMLTVSIPLSEPGH